MSREQWESLCDGCGKCCLHKLEDEDSGEVYYTKVACRYLDSDCRCRQYPRRFELVPGCACLQPDTVKDYYWLPQTCAYRLIADGHPLASWHPLISGDPDSIHRAGISVKDRVLSEDYVHPDGLEEHIITWVE